MRGMFIKLYWQTYTNNNLGDDKYTVRTFLTVYTENYEVTGYLTKQNKKHKPC